ncbi:MAG: hypothetical protein WC438_00200 [Candidatus Pacearchaeota archaeon]
MPICGFNQKMLEGLEAFNLGLIEKMPLCGFNKRMLEGLTNLNEGLVEHGLFSRAEKNNETLDQAIKREISDMSRLILELNRIDDTAKRILTEGIVKYAMGFYLIMRANGVNNIQTNYKDIIEGLSNYFFEMDKKYYGELEGKPEDMKELAQYLNQMNLLEK